MYKYMYDHLEMFNLFNQGTDLRWNPCSILRAHSGRSVDCETLKCRLEDKKSCALTANNVTNPLRCLAFWAAIITS